MAASAAATATNSDDDDTNTTASVNNSASSPNIDSTPVVFSDDDISPVNPWNSILSNPIQVSGTDSSSETAGTAILWNVNQLFQHGFRVNSSETEEESSLDTDARQLLERFPDNQQPFSDDAVAKRRHDLLERFLQLESPRLTDSMLEFISTDSVLELFIQFITRLPEEAKGRNRFSFDQHWTPLEAMETCRKSQRDFDNLDAQKLSYKTMLILCQSNQTTTRLYESRLREIVLHLFNVFQPRSNGNFYHVREVFQFLLKLQPRQFIEILIAPTPAYFQFPSDSHESMGEHKVQRPLLLNALPYAKEPAVADMIIEILFYPDPESNGNVSEIRLRTFKTLREHGFIEYLVDLISIDDPQEKYCVEIGGISDLVLRIIEQGVDCKETKLLLGTLTTNPDIINRLYQRLHDSDTKLPLPQRYNIIRVLHSICVKAQHVLPRPPLRQKLHDRLTEHSSSSELAELSVECSSILSRKISDICRLFTRGFMRPVVPVPDSSESDAAKKENQCETFKFSSFSVQHFITTDKLQFLEVFSQILRSASKESVLLDQIPSTLWTILVDWFFQYPFHNAYHCQFFALVHQILLADHRNCLKNCLAKTKLVPRLIAQYNDKSASTGCKGYIALILNYIRLCDEQQGPNDYIPQLLSSIAEWKDFLPLLERDTLRQVRPLVPFQVARPAPHFGPLSQKSNLFDSLSGSKPTIRNGIHLGSGFAMSLGFSVPSSIDEPNEQRQRPEEGSGENSSSKKTPSGKKKKKKKSGVNENLSINVSPTRAVEIEESAIQ